MTTTSPETTPHTGESAPRHLHVRCCIAGGGPAGMMLGFLLARAGVSVVVLEKHGDFLRDFRGDTVHPSTLQVMQELGLLDAFLARPHQEITQLSGQIEGEQVMIADFTHVPTRCHCIALMPQWDFLNFLTEHAKHYPAFQVMMQAEVTDLLEQQGNICGVRVTTPDGPLEVYADLTIGADGRHSTVRPRAKLSVDDLGAPIDVLWMRLSRQPSDASQAFGYVADGKIVVLLDRGSYWQCAYVIPKGSFATLRQHGLNALQDAISQVVPFLRDRVAELHDWDDIKLLTVSVDRLRQWYRPGLLCIGDAAHAMSPIGGVGINLAIQDAVAAANILVPAFTRGIPTPQTLARVQRRREWPTRMTQRVQIFVHDHVIFRTLEHGAPRTLPWPMRLLRWWPWLRRIPARMVGLGFRPEHVRTVAVLSATTNKAGVDHWAKMRGMP